MKKINSQIIGEGKFTRIELEKWQNRNGETFDWEVVRRANNNPVVSALVENITNKTFVLVEQFRIPVGKKVVELVAGVCDKPGATKIEIIKDEIIEETGYNAQKIIELSIDTPKSPGIISELGNSYYAQVIGERGEQNLQDNEDIEVLEFEKKDLNKFLASKQKEGILFSTGIYSIIGQMMARGINILE